MAGQYHVPVLLQPSIDGLNIRPGGNYVDLTFGGGGHSRAILEMMGANGRLIAFDQDADAWHHAPEDERFILVKHNFRFLQNFLDYLNVDSVDGVLGDLGVSSHHFDDPDRGFSFRYDGALDMRMGQGLALTAAKVLNDYPADRLQSMFRFYGEVPSVGRLVNAVVQFRRVQPFQTTAQLRSLIEPLAPKRDVNKYLAQVFQALRIEVNGEISALKELLLQIPAVLKPGGRLVMLTYHSLEDRLVKNFLRTGGFDTSQPERDIYGHTNLDFKAINRKVIQPDAREIAQNPRARSAKLRVAERL